MKNLKTSKLPPFFCFILLTLITTHIFVYASPTLNLTVTTNKSSYFLNETVHIYGNLTLDDTLIQDGLVGIQVDDPRRILIARTLTTGVVSQQNWLIEVINVIPSNESGAPKDSFEKGTLAYFNVTVRNNDIEMRIALVTVNVYDVSQIPMGLSSFKGVITENTNVTLIISVPIPTTATTGNATVYANVYSEWPKIGGKPYSPEQSATFQITNGADGASPTTPTQQELQGNYNTTFKLPPDGNVGTYMVSVSSIYQGHAVINNTAFEVKVPGDANGDGILDGLDLTLLGMAWGSSVGDPNYDERCDFNVDGTIDGLDLTLMGTNWGYRG